MPKYGPLPLVPLHESTKFYPVEMTDNPDENSPAIKVMTDFKNISPVTTEEEIKIDDALNKMKVYGVRLLLVVDVDKTVIGIISAKSIQGEKPIQISQEARISRADIRVDMIMTALSEIKVLNMANVRNAKVGHIIETLRQLGRQHVLVVDVDDASGQQTIRSLFSTSQISKQLGKDIREDMI